MKSILPIGVCAGLLLAGCMTEENPVHPTATGDGPKTTGPQRTWTDPENQSLTRKIMEMGFDSTLIKDHSDHFIAEDDVWFDKAELDAQPAAPLAKGEHYRSQYLVSDAKIHNLTVRVDPSAQNANPDYGWLTATLEAMNSWNGLGYFVKLTFVTTATADISVVGQYVSGAEGLTISKFPTSDGKPGNLIWARTDWPDDAPSKRKAMVHALGHCLGLQHPDGSSTRVINNTTSTTTVIPYAQIPSTPSPDPTSVMQGYGIEKSWNGFSFGDSQAMRRLYSSHIHSVANNPLRFLEDANGDGKKDLITFDQDGVVVSLSTGSGFANEKLWNDQYGSSAASGGWNLTNHVRVLADVNGDGKIDVVGFGNAGVYVALSNGSQFVPVSTAASSDFCYNANWRTNQHIRTMADVNGDGKADIVGFGPTNTKVALGQADGRFGTPTVWHNGYGYNNWNSVTELPRYVADVNGDGKADVVGFGNANVFVALSTGSTFNDKNQAPSWLQNGFCYVDGWRDAQHIRTMADVDGDGKKDIVGFGESAVYVGYSTGSAFGVVNGSPLFGRLKGYDKTRTTRILGDVNGDGKADIVAVDENDVFLGISNGSHAGNIDVFSVSTWNHDFAYNDGWRVADHLRAVGDITGDGKADFLGIGYNESYVGTYTQGLFAPVLYY